MQRTSEHSISGDGEECAMVRHLELAPIDDRTYINVMSDLRLNIPKLIN